MPTQRKPTTDAVEILHRRYYEGRPERLTALEEERAHATTACQARRNLCIGYLPTRGCRLRRALPGDAKTHCDCPRQTRRDSFPPRKKQAITRLTFVLMHADHPRDGS